MPDESIDTAAINDEDRPWIGAFESGARPAASSAPTP